MTVLAEGGFAAAPGSALIVLVWVVCAGVAALIAHSKGRSVGGFALAGLLLGPFGVILAAVLPHGAPPGLISYNCPRCNARQNVNPHALAFDCWYCHVHYDQANPA